jgi:hypothetical protein
MHMGDSRECAVVGSRIWAKRQGTSKLTSVPGARAVGQTPLLAGRFPGLDR